MQVYIRPLTLEDAKTSYKWRNNPKVWELTGSKPDKYITEEMETEWLKNVLQRKNEKRFAVCVKDTDQYIGNITSKSKFVFCIITPSRHCLMYLP